MTPHSFLPVLTVVLTALVACASEEAPEQSEGVIHQVKRVTPEEAARLTKAYAEAPLACRKLPAFCTISEPDSDGLVVFEADCMINNGHSNNGMACCY